MGADWSAPMSTEGLYYEATFGSLWKVVEFVMKFLWGPIFKKGKQEDQAN